jgi:N-acetylglucosamine kinase-like BadF-type ATPase
VTAPIAIAVDGGNSKTDLALVDSDGGVLALVRGGASSPHHLGLDGSLEVLDALRLGALDRAGLNGDSPAAAALFMAGVDFPSEQAELEEAVRDRRWAPSVVAENDTFAVLRAGTERGWGIAVTCGAGINCVGVSPAGQVARFPALGEITGDWGGGYDVGLAALSAAARSADGRGPETSLEHAVPDYFGFGSPLEVAEAIHRGRIPTRRAVELAPVVFREAESDVVAGQIVTRLAEEIVAFVRAVLDRLEFTDGPVEVLLGGGLLDGGDPRLLEPIDAGLREVGQPTNVRNVEAPPIVGSALAALDLLHAVPEAYDRVRLRLSDPAAREHPGTPASLKGR